jgi:predicted transcriptional regulator
MREVLISIQPKWVEKICRGEKTVEVRKTRPKCEVPFKCYIYETQGRTETPFVDEEGHHIFKGRGQVIGEFVCNKIDYWQYNWQPDVMHIQDMSELSCVSVDDLLKYSNNAKDTLYAWHISDLVIYDKPIALSEFQLPCDHENDCGTCKRAIYCGSTRQFCRCDLEDGLKRPPQSWCYIEPRQTAG